MLNKVSYFFPKDEHTITKGADAVKIDKLTAEAGDVKGNKVPVLGAGALHFDVCIKIITQSTQISFLLTLSV